MRIQDANANTKDNLNKKLKPFPHICTARYDEEYRNATMRMLCEKNFPPRAQIRN